MSLLHSLPAPAHPPLLAPAPKPPDGPAASQALSARREPPPYLRRSGFAPKAAEDFGDGGAFPEVHVPQYPLDMGRPNRAGGAGRTLNASVGPDGEVSYDAIVRQGSNSGRAVAASHGDLLPKVDAVASGAGMARPGPDVEEETVKDTWESLQRVVEAKISAAQPKTLGPRPAGPQYIKYTPSQGGPQFNSGAKQRIIKLQDMPSDPLEPPKFRHKKVPVGPGEPPVPIMHSPPRPVTVKDQQDWKIPPCVSNWKNAKGYTIPLDKRLAADGRGLQETAVSDKFAAFTEALYSAEHKAREALHMRNKVQKELMAREKEKKERELRDLAQRARLEHGGVPLSARVEASTGAGAPPQPEGNPHGRETRDEREERRRRDVIREERRREREREKRLEERDSRLGKKSKTTRDRERDVTEKVALGMAHVGDRGGEALYDTRLFNQDKGIAAGFGDDDAYNVYDKALFADRGTGLYRPKAAQDDDIYAGAAKGGGDRRFRADNAFQGTEELTMERGGHEGPVEFEADPFGLEDFVTTVKAGTRLKPLDEIGRKGGMKAAAGSSYEELSSRGHHSSRSRLQFEPGRR
eukprot:evm.model.scf_1162.5 EVM.evm.TU.scf_1162.5   scf_1162:31624-33363(-)